LGWVRRRWLVVVVEVEEVKEEERGVVMVEVSLEIVGLAVNI
jgi:hypothetical protein